MCYADLGTEALRRTRSYSRNFLRRLPRSSCLPTCDAHGVKRTENVDKLNSTTRASPNLGNRKADLDCQCHRLVITAPKISHTYEMLWPASFHQRHTMSPKIFLTRGITVNDMSRLRQWYDSRYIIDNTLPCSSQTQFSSDENPHTYSDLCNRYLTDGMGSRSLRRVL